MKNSNLRHLTTGGLFIALAIVLPLVVHIFSQTAGISFSPLQLPVIISAIFLPIRYSLMVGVLAPLLSSLLTGMPPLLPMAPLMAVECAAYAAILRAMLYKSTNIYVALLASMVGGRLLYTLAAGLMFVGFAGKGGFLAVVLSTFINSWPAIVLQLIVVPLFVFLPGSIYFERGK